MAVAVRQTACVCFRDFGHSRSCGSQLLRVLHALFSIIKLCYCTHVGMWCSVRQLGCMVSRLGSGGPHQGQPRLGCGTVRKIERIGFQ